MFKIVNNNKGEGERCEKIIMRKYISKNYLKKYYQEFLNRSLAMDLDGAWIEGFKYDIDKNGKIRLLDISDELKQYFYNESFIEIPVVFDLVEFINLNSFISKFNKPFSFIADSLVELDTNVFRDSLVKSVSLKSCKILNDNTFEYCKELVEVDIPNIKIIGDECFNGDNKLSKISINTVKKIGSSAFTDCISCTFDNNNFEYPYLLEMGVEAFCESGITNMCANRLKEIPKNCFLNSSLEYFRGDRVERVEEGAFNYSNLSNFVLPNLKYIGFLSFAMTQIQEFVSDLKYIGGMPFFTCVNLKKIVLPSIKNLEVSLAMDCNNLDFIELSNCKNIIGGLYDNCNLKSVYLPSLNRFTTASFPWHDKSVIIYLNQDCKIDDLALEIFKYRITKIRK